MASHSPRSSLSKVLYLHYTGDPDVILRISNCAFTDDKTRYYYVVAALGSSVASRLFSTSGTFQGHHSTPVRSQPNPPFSQSSCPRRHSRPKSTIRFNRLVSPTLSHNNTPAPITPVSPRPRLRNTQVLGRLSQRRLSGNKVKRGSRLDLDSGTPEAPLRKTLTRNERWTRRASSPQNKHSACFGLGPSRS
ncbi:hypothetical protein AAFF_G00150570 [Aldrovandia affinis]|uniref:Uncharacterized protein n=1 Tax=Aldrovandia affinis TaxID=143900 RepID=A0AAD7RRQ4_9TELE|nr:hypothetical protein AAFF_G00150570 [Aldrovandia affinis]